MVAIIKGSSSIARTLNYNEHKCREGRAELIHASGFIKDAKQMNFYDKINRFNMLNALNERTKVNTLHVSLNFDPSEQLSKETLTAIAQAYMEQVGFGQQPFLVYRHDDAAHPHMHIVSTTIQHDGKAISLHNIGRNKSEPARKSIEKEYNLIRAESRKKTLQRKSEPAALGYGQTPVKQSINNILSAVIDQYKYTTIGELNAILQAYNIIAERGDENSRMFQNKGLVYRALDASGRPVGPAIKSSRFYMKPTLRTLEENFEKNKREREPFKQGLKAKIDSVFLKNPTSIDEWKNLLRKQNIIPVIRTTDKGDIYGITYIDHHTKSVFNGSALGKGYRAKGIERKFSSAVTPSPEHKNETQDTSYTATAKQANDSTLIDVLLQPEFLPQQQLPFHLRRKKKKRKGRTL